MTEIGRRGTWGGFDEVSESLSSDNKATAKSGGGGGWGGVLR